MKIKQKKQLNLPQLIECIVQNDINNTFAELKSEYPAKQGIQIDRGGRLHLVGMDYLSKNNTFTVEVEEEIDEETKLGLLLDHFINPYGQHYVGNIYQNRSINDVLEENDEMEISTNSIHLFDKETKEFKLIWRNGKLVE